MKVTMKDIANKLGISINAVSIALNDKPGVSDEMRLEILKMADKMGYINQKRQYLSVYSKSNICILMQSYYADTGHFYSIVLRSIVEQAKVFGYFSILNYFENAWVNSYLKGLYPGENFLGFIKKNKILNSEAFNPLIVLVVFGAFLILSINAVSASLAITLAIAFIAFFIGSAILPRYFLNKEFKKPAIEFKSKDFYSIGFCLVLISILFFFVSVASVGGIPILKTSLRYQLKPLFTMPVFLIIPGVCILASAYLKKFQENKITRSQARFRFLILIGISCVFLLALGYRTPLLAVLLIMIIIGYYGNILAVWAVVVGALIGVCAIIGISSFSFP